MLTNSTEVNQNWEIKLVFWAQNYYIQDLDTYVTYTLLFSVRYTQAFFVFFFNSILTPYLGLILERWHMICIELDEKCRKIKCHILLTWEWGKFQLTLKFCFSPHCILTGFHSQQSELTLSCRGVRKKSHKHFLNSGKLSGEKAWPKSITRNLLPSMKCLHYSAWFLLLRNERFTSLPCTEFAGASDAICHSGGSSAFFSFPAPHTASPNTWQKQARIMQTHALHDILVILQVTNVTVECDPLQGRFPSFLL